MSQKAVVTAQSVTPTWTVALCLTHKVGEKFGFSSIVWMYCDITNALSMDLLIVCWLNYVIFILKCCSGRDTRVTKSEWKRQRWEGEIERLPTGNTGGISVKSMPEEDGLKLSLCGFLNVESFLGGGLEIGCRHLPYAAPTVRFIPFDLVP